MALLLTTLAITIVASLFWQQQVQVRSIENQRLQLQEQWILRGALDWASLILREDAKYSNVDALDEPWAVPLAETRLDQYVDNDRANTDISDATLSGSISDAQARYNLSNLGTNGSINPNEVAAFSRLLSNMKLDPALAEATASMIVNAQRSSLPNTGSRDNQSGVQSMNLTQVEDLLAVPGFSPEILDKLKKYVIFLPRSTPLNINTAPAELLAARIDGLSMADANSLVTSRSTASFRDLADFAHRFPGRPFSMTSNEVSVATNYFLVNGKVSMSRAGLEVQALVERYGAYTKLLWIREY